MLRTGDGIGDKSGVYFFISSSAEILYVGKATRDNLHQRVWDHVKTPEVLENGRRTFPDHGFRGGTGAAESESEVSNGMAHLGVITISDPDLASLVEVYLLTLHWRQQQRLPVFNKLIG